MGVNTLLNVLRYFCEPYLFPKGGHIDILRQLIDKNLFVYSIFVIDATLTYLLYFLIGVVGILDIAKQYVLQERLDTTAFLFCMLYMFQQIFIIEIYLKLLPWISQNIYLWICSDTLSTLAVGIILYR